MPKALTPQSVCDSPSPLDTARADLKRTRRILVKERAGWGRLERLLTRMIENLEGQVSDLRAAYMQNLQMRPNGEKQ